MRLDPRAAENLREIYDAFKDKEAAIEDQLCRLKNRHVSKPTKGHGEISVSDTSKISPDESDLRRHDMERIRHEIEQLRRVAAYDHQKPSDSNTSENKYSPMLEKSHSYVAGARSVPAVEKSQTSPAAMTKSSPHLYEREIQESIVPRQQSYTSPIVNTSKFAHMERAPTETIDVSCLRGVETRAQTESPSALSAKVLSLQNILDLEKIEHLNTRTELKSMTEKYFSEQSKVSLLQEENLILSRKVKEHEYGMIQQSAENSSLKVQLQNLESKLHIAEQKISHQNRKQHEMRLENIKLQHSLSFQDQKSQTSFPASRSPNRTTLSADYATGSQSFSNSFLDYSDTCG